MAALALLPAMLALGSSALAQPAAAPAPELFGVTAVSANADDFQRMGKSGVGTYRFMLHWPDVQELSLPLYDWARSDRQVAGAAKAGMEPLPFVYGSPRFAADGPRQPPLRSEASRDAWQAFLAAAVRRYGPGGELWAAHPEVPYAPVRTWQIWNEQNAAYYWGGEPSPESYAHLLALSDGAISSVDPGAQILLGGLYGNPRAGASIRMKPFLQGLYRVPSASEHFDTVALHPYAKRIRGVRRQVVHARRVMDTSGDGAKGIWITEVGWATDGPKGHRLVATARGQARKLRKAFRLFQGRLAPFGIARVLWFAWRDFDDPRCLWCGGAGLLRQSGEAKPALKAYTRFTGGS